MNTRAFDVVAMEMAQMSVKTPMVRFARSRLQRRCALNDLQRLASRGADFIPLMFDPTVGIKGSRSPFGEHNEMETHLSITSAIAIEPRLPPERNIESLERKARDLAHSVETLRQQTLLQSNERIESLEQKARDLARFVETTRQKTLLESDRKTEALEQKARDLADFVETLRNKTLLQSEAEIEALGQRARELARSVEAVRKETRVQSALEIDALSQQARELAISVESAREATLLHSETEIAALGQQARDLAVAVESVREETLLQTNAEIEGHITAKKVAEQSALLLAAVVESSEDAILTMSLDGIVTSWNAGAERLYGRTTEDALGHQVDFLVPADRVRELASIMARLYQGERVEHFETVRLHRDGTRIDVSLSISLIYDEEGRVVGVSKIARDITAKSEIKDLKQQALDVALSVEKTRLNTLIASDMAIRKVNAELEQRVLERTAQLEAANKELESFSYSVSHDLRAPLRAIDGFSRILMEDHAGSLPEEGMNFLTLVRTNTQQMSKLVDDLLAFSRLGRLELTRQTVHPARIVGQCLSEMKTEQENRQIEIEIGELSSCQADPVLLKQVWTNLLSNALKYSRKQEYAHIEIGCRSQLRPPGNAQTSIDAGADTETVYFVKDNGAGFDMKYVDKLFGVFQRLHRVADYEGTGVGLAIAQRIIFRHGGRIWGESLLNQGATFSFTLE